MGGMSGQARIAIYPNVAQDGIGTYIHGIKKLLGLETPAYEGNIMSPRQFLRKPPGDFDLVHVPHILVPLSCGRAKVVCTIQDITMVLSGSTPFPHRAYLWFRTAWSLRRAHHVIFTSNATRREVEKTFGAVPRHSVIPLACDDPVPERDIPPRPVAERYFLHVGRRRQHKNVGRIIRALARTAPEAILVLGGKPDIDDEALRAQARAAGVEERVRFTGFLSRERLAAFYRYAEALVFPSLMEGFGIPILEAMSYGCPVITSDRSSMPEISGGKALLVDPEDVGSIAGAMRAIWEDPGLGERLRTEGLEHFRNFSWRRTAEATKAVYETVLAGDGRKSRGA